MPPTALSTIVAHCEKVLQSSRFQDWDGALNGLQVENDGRVSKIAAAVDASLATIQKAIAAKADLLIVHHGLFWSKRQPWTGKNYEIIQALLAANLAVYSSHLPLDAHPTLGNNAQLAAALRLKHLEPFYLHKGEPIGLQTRTTVKCDELLDRLKKACGADAVRQIFKAREKSTHIGIVTGGSGSELARVAADGIDTFITGEGPHWTYSLAEELGVNLFYAGHYATETFGVKALAEELSQRFKVPWEFIDHPSGL
jgi:dinuclear metal center YbgI/SA1388 family protein